ncbi:hypothetical protein [Flagellimonas aequoris]|uniref:Uncharacterized protein n=1 Tax=Flagellimonas aequoris TaxID=2306997 RepID=A0A418N9E7_9FLAO|nr:hypothetical protein [Allomuricauda aequoris]RIV72157.1 hypothetical protein D2U88_06815 [Allomuricauda aequoris]TXK03930.1 hypothetical protein FQ019_06770 [Allomuricauda aequoris]
MEELYKFITEQYFLPFYLIVWLVAVARYRTFFDTPLKYHPIYLMYTFLTELLGYLVKHTDEFQFFSEKKYDWHNVIIFNIYSVIAFSFFFYIYWKVLKSRKHKKWVVYGTIISMLSYVVSLFFQDPLHMNLYYADLIASMILLFDISLYVKEKKSEEGAYPVKHNLMFWTTLGLAVFHAIFPYLFLIAYEAPEVWAQYQLREVLKVLIVFMYGTFMIGALLGKRNAFR